MKMYNIRGLNGKANFALNDAIRLATRKKSLTVEVGHLMLALLKNADIADSFLDDTGVSVDEYSYYLDKATEEADRSNQEQSKTCGVNSNNKIKELTIEDFTPGLRDILSQVISEAEETNILATCSDIYYAIMNSDADEFWSLMPEEAHKKVLASTSDPLRDMPETSKYAVSFNKLAKSGSFDPMYGRKEEMDKLIEILGRRVKNNPCLVGEPGVGKTAIVEGLAQRIVSGDVPYYLKNSTIICVDISSVVGGAKFRGEFEERLNNILDEAASHDGVILFFDEIHMLMEAGASSESPMAAANIIKPAISRGDVRIIGATTTSEFKRFIDKDKAFERRLQRIVVEEPSLKESYAMVGAVIKKYDKFHNSITSQGVIEAAVNISDRYIADKKLPDKAITVIDETAARLKRFTSEGSTFTITVRDIKETVSKITGIDIQDINAESRNKLMNLNDKLSTKVIGQTEAVSAVSKAIIRSKAGIKDPNRPIGSFLFVGPTGVGKTELSKVLAEEFSGNVKNLIRFDMSEFMEKHTVSRLIGSPPGYVGYGEGGQLTEAVKNNPYSVLLFDEIEKAHPDVFNIMLQILDDGQLTDSEGSKVDFKNTIIILTSNAGYGKTEAEKRRIGFSSDTDRNSNDNIQNYSDKAMKALESTFRPEFLNRLDKVVVFNELGKEEIKKIASIYLNKLKDRLTEHKIGFKWSEDILGYIVDKGFDKKYGARNIKRTVQTLLEDKIADMIVSEQLVSGDTLHVSIGVGDLAFNISSESLVINNIELRKLEEVNI